MCCMRLVRAHRRAADFVEDVANRDEVAAILAAPNRIGVAPEVHPPHARRPAEGRAGRHDAHRATAICWSAATAPARPDPVQAAWLYAQMVRWGQAPLSAEAARRREGGVPARSL